jgi:hypothetical protein
MHQLFGCRGCLTKDASIPYAAAYLVQRLTYTQCLKHQGSDREMAGPGMYNMSIPVCFSSTSIAVQHYRDGRDMGAMIPCFINTRGLTASWKDSFVIHSGPMGSLRARSYWALDSKGWGS